MQSNMKLIAQHALNGYGGMGEGMSLQLARGGRRVLWLAHESAPNNFTALEVSGELMVVAYQVSEWVLKPAGFELFDISEPERPRSIAMFDASGPHSRGCHALWFVDGKTVHMACGDP